MFFVYKRWSLFKKSLFTISYLNPHQRLCYFVRNLQEFLFVSNVNHESSHGKKYEFAFTVKYWDEINVHATMLHNKSLVDSDRTTMLFGIKQSRLGTIFPGTYGRRCSTRWEEKFPWLRYSSHKDAGFCINCLAFGSHTDRNDIFTGLGFRDWKMPQG